MAHVRQPGPDSGLGFQGNVLKTLGASPSMLNDQPLPHPCDLIAARVYGKYSVGPFYSTSVYQMLTYDC